MSPERDLIQRLADELQVWIDNARSEFNDPFKDEQALIDEARAYLAQTELRSAKAPTTPKPEFPPGRVTDVHGRTIGYRSINYPDPSPDRRPTNPFNGERIPNQPPREP